MEYALSKNPQDNFITPDKVPAEKPVIRGEWRGGNEYEIDKISLKLATAFTPEETKEKKVVQEVHSILYWTRGIEDSQFKNWESVVRGWAQQRGLLDQNESVIPKLYPISQVDYFVEDEFIGSSKKEPFLINFSQQITDDGLNQIKVKIKIYDSVKNSAEETFIIP